MRKEKEEWGRVMCTPSHPQETQKKFLFPEECMMAAHCLQVGPEKKEILDRKIKLNGENSYALSTVGIIHYCCIKHGTSFAANHTRTTQHVSST